MSERIAKPVQFEGKPAKQVPFLSAAIVSNGFVFCSGQVGARPDGSIVEGSIGGRVAQIMDNLDSVLQAHGSGLQHIVKVNIYITDYKDFDELNRVYVSRIPNPPPARSCIGVKALPRGTDVEIECIAVLPGPESNKARAKL